MSSGTTYPILLPLPEGQRSCQSFNTQAKVCLAEGEAKQRSFGETHIL